METETQTKLRVATTLIYYLEWVQEIEPFTEEEIVKEIHEMVSKYPTPKQGWDSLNAVFLGDTKFPLSTYMVTAGREGCIKRIQERWNSLI